MNGSKVFMGVLFLLFAAVSVQATVTVVLDPGTTNVTTALTQLRQLGIRQ